jgi:hypothetical protein
MHYAIATQIVDERRATLQRRAEDARLARHARHGSRSRTSAGASPAKRS